MSHESEKRILEEEIEMFNQEIQNLAYRLSELLNVDCNLGVCTFDPAVDDVQEKLKEIEEKKRLLVSLKEHIDQYDKKNNP